MSNAAKHRKKAAEFEQLKQIDRAIASYVRAIEESESEGEDVDVALLNKVGDLALRQGRVPDAVTYYERAVEHYATAGLFNNAIALCNKILRNAPGRSNVYFTLGRICGKKGLRGDATRNFLEYASRMQQEGRVEEAMRALSEVAELMPELTEVSRLVEEHAARAGVQLPRRRTPLASEVIPDTDAPRYQSDKSKNLVFLDVDYGAARARGTPPYAARVNAVPKESAPTHSTPVSPGAAIPTPPVAPSLPFIELAEAVDTPDEPVLELAAPNMLSIDSVDVGALDLIDLDTSSLESLDVGDAASLDLPLMDLEPIELPMIDWTDEPTRAIELELTAFDDVLGADAPTPHVERSAPLEPSSPAAPSPLESAVPDVAASAVPGDAAAEPRTNGFRDVDVPELVRENIGAPPLTPPTLEETGAAFAEFSQSLAEDASVESVPLVSSDAESDLASDVASGERNSQPTAARSDSAPADAAESALEGAPDVALAASERTGAFGAESTAETVGDADGEPTPDASVIPPTEAPSVPVESSGIVQESTRADVDASSLIPSTSAPMVVRRTMPTPVRNASRTPSRTPLRSLEIPSIEAAIEAGAQLAARMAADTTTQQRRPPYRLDPHDFILPGELPPLLVDDDLVNAGLDRAVEHKIAALAAADSGVVSAEQVDAAADIVEEESLRAPAQAWGETPTATPFTSATPIVNPIVTPIETPSQRTPAVAEVPAVPAERATPAIEGSATFIDARERIEGAPHADAPDVAVPSANETSEIEVAPNEAANAARSHKSPADTLSEQSAAVHASTPEPAPPPVSGEATATASPSIEPPADGHSDAQVDPTPIAQSSAVRLTPALPIAAVAAEAKTVALSRRDELRAAVAAEPQDWALRRRLAEALFEAGQRDAGLSEMEASLNGFSQGGQLEAAADLSEDLVRIAPDRVAYHQKRVELAVRLKDQQRLRFAYLDLADTLVRSGEEGRAQAVYVRVLEIDPRDDRARAALGSAAPPLPAPPAAPVADGFVNLADWLRDDDGPASTRMRMREPEVSGDEQADFDALLRHFKEGVSRSLGEEDYESRYDLGVAFKEMGLLDDAIAEFQKALRSKAHRLPAYEALGQCFVEQGRFQIAATVLSRALHEPGLNDEQRIGVLYLLAYSCEALQRWGEARSYFQRVYATDINFRDVAARLAALEQVAS